MIPASASNAPAQTADLGISRSAAAVSANTRDCALPYRRSSTTYGPARSKGINHALADTAGPSRPHKTTARSESAPTLAIAHSAAAHDSGNHVSGNANSKNSGGYR